MFHPRYVFRWTQTVISGQKDYRLSQFLREKNEKRSSVKPSLYFSDRKSAQTYWQRHFLFVVLCYFLSIPHNFFIVAWQGQQGVLIFHGVSAHYHGVVLGFFLGLWTQGAMDDRKWVLMKFLSFLLEVQFTEYSIDAWKQNTAAFSVVFLHLLVFTIGKITDQINYPFQYKACSGQTLH